MAVTFTLTSTGLTTIDFRSGTDFTLQTGYVPVVATPTGDGSIPPYVTEVVPVMLRGTSYDDYALSMQELAALQKRAAEYWVDQQQAVPVWFNCKGDGETTGRQALVKCIDFEFRPTTSEVYEECAGGVPPPEYLLGTILIERHPYWERTATRTFPNTIPAAAAAVAYDYTATADIVGDVPARVNALGVRSPNAFIGCWMGIRSASKHGATGVTAFRPIWECESGENIIDNSIADDGGGTEPGTASPGGAAGDFVNVDPEAGGAVIDWDDGDFHEVCYVSVAHAGYATMSNADGRFLVLLRARVQTASTWETRITKKLLSTTLEYYDPVAVTSISWTFGEMGIVDIPGRSKQAAEVAQLGVGLDRSWAIGIEARRTGGADDLRLDCLVFIPIDEGFLKLVDPIISAALDAWFCEGPKDTAQALSTTDAANDYFSDVVQFEAETFRLPPGDGRIICAFGVNDTVLTEQIEFADPSVGASSYTERWTVLRGAE